MKSKKDAKIQSTFKLPVGSQSSACKVCGMTYLAHVKKDKDLHLKYHKKFVGGVPWPQSEKSGILFTKSIRPLKVLPLLLPIEVSFVSVSKSSALQLKRVEEILKMVNTELSAPLDSQEWKNTSSLDAGIEGRAMVAISGNKAIGIVTTDPIHSTATQCKWMVYKNQLIVPNQVNHSIKIGISRIWTAPNYRGMGIAKYLLQCVVEHSIYGVKLFKNEIAFSQPSFAGGLLAKSFNGVVHKSGEILIPVYIEK